MLIQATLLSVTINFFAGVLGTSVEGGLDKSAIREVVRANIGDVRECYNAELVRDETAQGRVMVSFVILPDGTVTKTDVPESTMSERFDACLVSAVNNWSFPKAGESTSVVYPFEMSPG